MYLARRVPHRRSFVSTVLLSRTWDSHTVVELRSEAKTRGLSTKGNKSTLIARIREHDENSAPAHATSPGVLQPHSTSARSDFPAITLPDIPQHPPDAPVQVPYVPDFWNSARSKPIIPLEPERPKLHVVGGSATHYDGGPTYNLEKPHEDGAPSMTVYTNAPPVSNTVGFWPDFWDSMGLPRSFSPRRSLSEARSLAVQTEKNESNTRSRPLTNEEKRGVYILLGVLGGSWLVGWSVN